MTAGATVDPLPPNPWEKWGWAFAAIWLVFLAFPIIAVAESDVPLAVKIGVLAVHRRLRGGQRAGLLASDAAPGCAWP